uniref:C3H1-type domain-containing protein n=1 Tax=Neolamprologus brichardi TaxID=32507 RepID=A0A3Q4G671_NEOBR
SESAERCKDGAKVCQFFRIGKCHFGLRCRLAHRFALLTLFRKVIRTEVNKKPRMRTADEVISRILWDPSVDASEFVVGYVDRFLGVLERPFCDFNWETNPCDCDYTVELALPRHRIQYFTYRGHRVWDRHTRTDRVFGSTGQSLAPPFGGEEEVRGRTKENTAALETTNEQPPAEEEKQNETNIHTPESAPPPPECTGNTSQEQQELYSEYSTSGHEILLLHCMLCYLNVSFLLQSYPAVQQVSKNPSVPLEQREEKRGGRPPKKRPTHFITFRANTPAILSCFQQLQKELTSLIPSSAPHWQTASSLHVTLCLLVLHSPAEVAAAGEILQRFAQLDRNPPVAVTFPVKLKHFNGKVLYLSPQPQLHLQQLNSGLQEAYRKEGFLHRNSYNPRYHLSLARVLDREGEKIFEGVGDLRVGKGLNFGRLPVNTLHLCAMGGSKVDGFYERVCSVTLR